MLPIQPSPAQQNELTHKKGKNHFRRKIIISQVQHIRYKMKRNTLVKEITFKFDEGAR